MTTMSKLEISMTSPGQVKVKGDLNFASINKKTVKAISFGHSRYNDGLTIDLGDVGKSDSAGLALMIEWIKLGKEHHTRIAFTHIPEQLWTLAKLSGLDENEYFSKALQS